jgi:hypothetical protein
MSTIYPRSETVSALFIGNMEEATDEGESEGSEEEDGEEEEIAMSRRSDDMCVSS